jgi:hypothetical protein
MGGTAMRKLFFRIFKCYRRLELRCVTYAQGDNMIRENAGKPERHQWTIAKEEDRNIVVGIVYLERRERITE